jgi:hypothetical protein
MKFTGTLLKMEVAHKETVEYTISLSENRLPLNQFLGQTITFRFQNEIYCISCGRKTKKSFGQGFCYPCFQNSPENDPCILHPELCRAHEGISRNMEWSQQHCLQDHIVYLAISSSVKVGVTRQSQVPVRWIDQGASKAIKIARTPNRYLAGLMEVDLKNHFADKTNWQQMLKNQHDTTIDLLEQKRLAYKLIEQELQKYFIEDNTILSFNYPVLKYPTTVKSIDFEKKLEISGKLSGIKGQYLIFDTNEVINIRKHNGYLVEFEY